MSDKSRTEFPLKLPDISNEELIKRRIACIDMGLPDKEASELVKLEAMEQRGGILSLKETERKRNLLEKLKSLEGKKKAL